MYWVETTYGQTLRRWRDLQFSEPSMVHILFKVLFLWCFPLRFYNDMLKLCHLLHVQLPTTAELLEHQRLQQGERDVVSFKLVLRKKPWRYLKTPCSVCIWSHSCSWWQSSNRFCSISTHSHTSGSYIVVRNLPCRQKERTGRVWKGLLSLPPCCQLVMNLAGDWLSVRLSIGPVGIREWEREKYKG